MRGRASKHILALVRAMLHTSPRREESRVDQEQHPRWRIRVLWLGGILVALLVVFGRLERDRPRSGRPERCRPEQSQPRGG